MHKLFTLIKWELSVQNRLNNSIRYFLLSSFFFSLVFIPYKFRAFYIICFLVPSVIISYKFIFKKNSNDSMLDFLLTTFNPVEIIIAKFSAISAASLTNFVLNAGLAYIFIGSTKLILINMGFILILLFNLNSILVLLSTYKTTKIIMLVLVILLLMLNIFTTCILLTSDLPIKSIIIIIGINITTIIYTITLSCRLIKNIYNA